MKTLITGILLVLTCTAYAQQDSAVILTLDECIDIALENNIGLRKAKNNAQIARSNRLQAMLNFLPTLQAQVNYNFLYGTFWDNVAARQVTQQNSSNPNLSSSFTVFNGMKNVRGLKSAQFAEQSAEEAISDAKLNLESNVLTAYLAVILDRENIKISEARVALLEAQLEREIKRESVGVGNLEIVYNLRSQLANEKLSLTQLQNQKRSDMLALIQLLRLDVTQPYELEANEEQLAEVLPEMDPYVQVLEESYTFSPSIKSARASHEASVYQYKMTKSDLMPVLSVYGEIGSRYSSQGAANPENNFQVEKASYWEQMEYNEYEFLGLSLNIPLFTRYRTANSIQTSKLNMFNAELDVQQAEQNLTNTVQQVYLDLISSRESYKTAKENLSALEASFEFARKRYETGNTDFYTYLESLNNKNRAEIELVNAKYSIIFRRKVLDLYRGERP